MTATASPPRPFWRQDDPILNEDGATVRGGMWPHQREWWNLPNFIRGLVTGYGGGKSFMLGKRMIWLARENAPVPVATVSPTYPIARETIVRTIDDLCSGRSSGREFSHRLYKRYPFEFQIQFGESVGTILCFSGEHPDRLKGTNLAAAGIDEPFLQQHAVLDQMLARVRHPDARVREINLTGTPEELNWGYDLLFGELRQRYDVGLVQASSRKNLSLPAGYVDRMAQAFDDKHAQAFIEGQFVNLSTGQVYHCVDPERNFVEAPPGVDDWEQCAGMDFNVNPMAYVVFARNGDRLHFLREYEKPNSDTPEACAELRADFPKLRDVYPDVTGQARKTAAAGKSDHDQIRMSGLTVRAHRAQASRRDRFNSVNAALRSGNVTIGPECKKLRRYLQSYTFEGMNETAQKAMSHLLDAFGYPVEFLLPVHKHEFSLY